MYTVMIVEDELLVRMGLNTSIPWSSLDMQVIAAESNGESAWETFCEKKPDVVLTDLRMPGMSGTELIEKIRGVDSRCEIIVITCIEEFDVLYQLMKLHITGYLLKATMSQDDILNLLRQAGQNLAGQRNASLEGGAADEKDELLRAFLLKHHDAALYRKECERQGCAPEPFGGLLLVQPEDAAQKPLLLPTVRKIFLDRLAAFAVRRAFTDRDCLVYLLPEESDAPLSELSASLTELSRYSADILGAKLRMALLRCGDDDFALAWEQGQKALQDEFFYPDGITVLRDGVSSAQRKLAKRIDSFREHTEMIPWKSPRKKESFFVRLQDLRSSFENREAFLQVAAELAELFRASFFGEQLPAQETLAEALAAEPSAFAVLECLASLLFPAQESSRTVYGERIFETMRYIRDHAEESINLSSLANMVSLSPNYYATLFKQMAGCSFSEYLGNVRMERACTLLDTTELSVLEIAQRCGYSDMTYFIRFFKQKMGKPPRRWRRES